MDMSRHGLRALAGALLLLAGALAGGRHSPCRLPTGS